MHRWHLTGLKLACGGEQGLELRRGGVFVDEGGGCFAKASVGEHGLQLRFAEAEPLVGVEGARFLKAMLHEVEDDDAAGGAQDARSFFKGALGMERVVERLREEDAIDRSGADGQLFHVADSEVDVFDSDALRVVAADVNHLFRAVDGDDFFGALGEEQGEGAFARAEVGDDHGRQEAQQRFGEALPGFPWDIVGTETACDGVKEAAHLVLALFEDAAHGGLVGGELGGLLLGVGEDFAEDLMVGRVGWGGGEAVEAVLPGAAVFDEARLPELREVGGDGALAHGEDFLQFGDGELLGPQEEQDAEAVGVGEDAQGFHD